MSKRRGEDTDVWMERRKEAGQGDCCGLNTRPVMKRARLLLLVSLFTDSLVTTTTTTVVSK